jgi:hypothetical protein
MTLNALNGASKLHSHIGKKVRESGNRLVLKALGKSTEIVGAVIKNN